MVIGAATGNRRGWMSCCADIAPFEAPLRSALRMTILGRRGITGRRHPKSPTSRLTMTTVRPRGVTSHRHPERRRRRVSKNAPRSTLKV
jgi:hypothetical protein